MPMLGKAEKQSGETENYSISYAQDLVPGDGFSILSIVLTPAEDDDAPPVIESYVADVPGQKVTMFITGGTHGFTHQVTVKVQTDSGRVLEDDFKLRIKDY